MRSVVISKIYLRAIFGILGSSVVWSMPQAARDGAWLALSQQELAQREYFVSLIVSWVQFSQFQM